MDYVQFLPDGERLLVCCAVSETESEVAIWHPFTETKIALELPHTSIDGLNGDPFFNPFSNNRIAIPETGGVCYLTGNDQQLYAFDTTDGTALNVPANSNATQVIITHDGGWLVTVDHEFRDFPNGTHTLRGIAITPSGGEVLWQLELDGWHEWPFLGGFLPGDEHFTSVSTSGVHVRSFKDGTVVRSGRFPAQSINLPRLTPDGTRFGVVGYSSFYLYDVDTLAKPGRISASQAFGDFRSFSFHPSMNRMAMIYSGPTLVKLFDLNTLKVIEKLNWKIGKLTSVDYSPNGALAAAGSEDGRVVIWDVET